MTTIIGIGGGELNLDDNLPFNRFIVKQVKTAKPNALFIPAASNDNPLHYKIFKEVYGENIGCKTDQLLLMNEPMKNAVIEEKIDKADIIFVGPGNSFKMMRRFRYLGVDSLLYKAWQSGTIMAGIGAGASCWFEFGHNNTMPFYKPKKKDSWKFLRVKSLGLVDRMMFSPYYDDKERQEDLMKMVNKQGPTGIGLPEKMAIVIKDRHYKLFANNTKAMAYKVYKIRGKSISVPIEMSDDWRSLGQLLSKM